MVAPNMKLRRFLGALILAPLLVVLPAIAAPQIGATLQEWMDATDVRLADAESRIAALEEQVNDLSTSTTTTTVPTTTTTIATTTTQPTTTTTSGDLTPSGPISVGSNTVIENMAFTGSGNQTCVHVTGSNVIIRNSTFHNCYKGVYALNSSNIVVEDSSFTATNVYRNAVQFDKVQGGRVSRITVNVPINTLSGNGAEDHVSFYQSNGTSSNPMVVEDSTFVGGGPSDTGSCVMMGDVGGTWQIARRNHCTNTANVGIAIAGGHNNKILDNTVIANSQNAGGSGDVGIYVWSYDGSSCSNHEVSGNTVSWRKQNGSFNNFWNGGNCNPVSVTGNSWQ